MHMSATTADLRDTLAADAGRSAPAAAAKGGLRSRRGLLALGTALAVAAAGTLYIVTPASTQVTDDAYIGADATTVAPKVRGLVAQVLVQDNQQVHAGDALVRIDAEEFDA